MAGRDPAPPEVEGGPPAPLQHYFSERPQVGHRRRTLRFLYRGRVLTCLTDRGVFASEGLDPGTALLIENMLVPERAEVLDVGSGWGPIGLAAAIAAPRGRVVLVDPNRRAVSLSRENLAANGVSNAEVFRGSFFVPVEERRFDLVVSNPPYHLGRAALEHFFSEVPVHLKPHGRLLLVGKGSQGALYYQHRLGEVFARVEILARGGGYRVLEASDPRSRPGPSRRRSSPGSRPPGVAKS